MILFLLYLFSRWEKECCKDYPVGSALQNGLKKVNLISKGGKAKMNRRERMLTALDGGCQDRRIRLRGIMCGHRRKR